MKKPQIIFDSSGRPAFVVIHWSEYSRLANEDPDSLLSDEELYDRAKAEGDEFFPIEVVDRLLAGEHPIKVYRTHRGMTQGELAAAVGVHKMYVSQIETGRRVGSTKTLTALARALNVGLDDLTRGARE